MKYTIKDSNQFFDLAGELGLKPGASVQNIVASLIQREAENDAPDVMIFIDLGLVASSYGTVPAAFSQAIKRSHGDFISYSEIQSFVKHVSEENLDYLVVYAGSQKTPTSFRARAKRDIVQSGIFKIARKRVPLSYRERPALLTAVLTRDTGLPICNRCKGAKLVWYVDEDKKGKSKKS